MRGGHRELGPMAELRILRHAARFVIKTGDIRPWMEAWVGTSLDTHASIWSPNVSTLTDNFIEVRAPGLHMVAPYPHDVLEQINAAIENRRLVPRTRRSDRLMVQLGEALVTAATAMFGKKAIKQRNRARKIRRLARDFEQYFRLGLYAEDSRRLRALTRMKVV
jgi:hypothetical protein